MKRPWTEVDEDLSLNHLEYKVLRRGHYLRRLLERDKGTDARMEHYDEHRIIDNGEVRFQLKATRKLKTIDCRWRPYEASEKDYSDPGKEAFPVSQDKRTYAELDQLLAALRFEVAQSEDRSKTYWHQPSDTILLIPAAKPATSVTEADLTSVQVHLAGRGLLSQSAFDEFVATGVIPTG
jgi:hypothetical protein